MEGPALVSAVIMGMVVVAFISKSIFVVRPHERGVVETIGRFSRLAEPGVTMVIPLVQSLRRVDMREAMLQVAMQIVDPGGSPTMTVKVIMGLQVTDPVRNTYGVTDFHRAAAKAAEVNLHRIASGMPGDTLPNALEDIGSELREAIGQFMDMWGARLTRLELQPIESPRDVA